MLFWLGPLAGMIRNKTQIVPVVALDSKYPPEATLSARGLSRATVAIDPETGRTRPSTKLSEMTPLTAVPWSGGATKSSMPFGSRFTTGRTSLYAAFIRARAHFDGRELIHAPRD